MRFNQSEGARRNAILEQPLPCAEDHWINPDAKFVDEGERRISAGQDYNSHNTRQLDVAGMKQLLLRLDFMQRITRGESIVMDD